MTETYKRFTDLEMKNWDAGTLVLAALVSLKEANGGQYPEGLEISLHVDAPTPLTLEFRINGVEVPFTVIVERLVANYKADVQTAARKLFQDEIARAGSDKLLQMSYRMGELSRTMEQETRALARKAFPDAYIPEEDCDD